MIYRLHDGLQTGGAVVRAALAEIGTPHDVILTDIRTGDHLSDTYSALNPRQQVPTLIFPDGQIMTESSAILVHLADRYPEAALLPSPGSALRGQTLRWLAFCATNLYEGESRKLHPDRYTVGEPDGVRTAAHDFIDRNYLVLETAFSNGPFLAEACRSILSMACVPAMT